MPKLKLSSTYSRKEVHDIFSPDTNFTPQAGTWGMHGLVQIPERESDYVFFVTYGQEQSGHEFDESISDDGVLTWQSQPRQKQDNKHVQKWISHDELVSNIYLFLRTRKVDDYRYMGRLKYLTHDPDREKPVHFQWQLLDWDELEGDDSIDIVPVKSDPAPTPSITQGLTEASPPPPKSKAGSKKERSFSARRKPDYSAKDAANKKLGLAGEKLVYQYERERLKNEGRSDLAEKVTHVSVEEGDGAGYDIRSYEQDGTVLYLEVKTTKGGASTAFYMSINEVVFANTHSNSYRLVRVYEYNDQANSGRFFNLDGDIVNNMNLEPIKYRVTL